MSEITTYPFNAEQVVQVCEYHFGMNWPVVYILENKKEVYIGETVSAYSRSRQHLENSDRRRLNRMHIVTDEEFNKSAALDIESLLIQYMSAEGSLVLQNGNKGLVDHNYYDREKYQAKFETIWDKLKAMSLVSKDLKDIRNSDLFKFSPFKALTVDQILVADQILEILRTKTEATIVISGKPGTGKTILAIYLMKRLKEEEEFKQLKTALVVPMASLRETLKGVFSFVKNLSGGMVKGPSHVTDSSYDLLIVDEAHRLHRRRNIVNYASHDKTNQKLGLANDGTELDWIMKSARYKILFYDEKQHVRPSDVTPADFKKLAATHLDLQTQKRVEGGDEYIQFIDSLFNESKGLPAFKDYDFKIFDSLELMVKQIDEREKEVKLSRLVAGYAWEWISKKNKALYDIEIDGVKLKWNSVNTDWVNSPNSANEVGCIHTIQGYDLNYTGVIIGPEMTYDPISEQLKVVKGNYKDRNGHAGVDDSAELERYIFNIYRTLLTRGMKGTYVYAVDPELRAYLKRCLLGE
ncbi:MAG: DNA/RNA helicase domain-containing protein [Patescibacteria group bacterium]